MIAHYWFLHVDSSAIHEFNNELTKVILRIHQTILQFVGEYNHCCFTVIKIIFGNAHELFISLLVKHIKLKVPSS